MAQAAPGPTSPLPEVACRTPTLQLRTLRKIGRRRAASNSRLSGSGTAARRGAARRREQLGKHAALLRLWNPSHSSQRLADLEKVEVE